MDSVEEFVVELFSKTLVIQLVELLRFGYILSKVYINDSNQYFKGFSRVRLTNARLRRATRVNVTVADVFTLYNKVGADEFEMFAKQHWMFKAYHEGGLQDRLRLTLYYLYAIPFRLVKDIYVRIIDTNEGVDKMFVALCVTKLMVIWYYMKTERLTQAESEESLYLVPSNIYTNLGGYSDVLNNKYEEMCFPTRFEEVSDCAVIMVEHFYCHCIMGDLAKAGPGLEEMGISTVFRTFCTETALYVDSYCEKLASVYEEEVEVGYLDIDDVTRKCQSLNGFIQTVPVDMSYKGKEPIDNETNLFCSLRDQTFEEDVRDLRGQLTGVLSAKER